MEAKPIPFQFEDKLVAGQLLETVSELIKDSDAQEEKEAVKRFLQRVSEAMTFVAIGDEGTGKSSFLNQLFEGSLYAEEIPFSTRGIREIRGGAQEAEFSVDSLHTRYFGTDPALEGICVVDTQGLDTLEDAGCREKIKGLVQKSDVLFVVFDVLHIKSYSVWEFLEEVNSKKVVFVITKCDLTDEETLQMNKLKLQQYIAEAGLDSPVFLTSAGPSEYIGDAEDIGALREYIRSRVLGENPVLTREQQNVAELTNMLAELNHSFDMRKRQYESDMAILQEISNSMDAFVMRNERVVSKLKSDLTQTISDAINEYSNVMIEKMNPAKIKEKCFGGVADAEGYLAEVNENYRNLMNEQISGKTQEAVRLYLSDLQNVFEEATGFFRKRQSLIDLEDKFYGSMAVTKNEVIHTVETSIVDLDRFYEKLANASEKLFMEAWQEREEYDRKVRAAGEKGGIGGSIAGAVLGAGGVMAVKALVAAEVIAKGAMAASAPVLWPVIGILVGGVLINKIAKKMAAAKSASEMDQAYRESVAEFKEEVEKIRCEMTEQVLQTVTEIFDRELHSADNSFAEFRMTVNIDSRNIPLLETKMETVNDLLSQITQMQKKREKEAVPVIAQSDRMDYI